MQHCVCVCVCTCLHVCASSAIEETFCHEIIKQINTNILVIPSIACASSQPKFQPKGQGSESKVKVALDCFEIKIIQLMNNEKIQTKNVLQYLDPVCLIIFF